MSQDEDKVTWKNVMMMVTLLGNIGTGIWLVATINSDLKHLKEAVGLNGRRIEVLQNDHRSAENRIIILEQRDR